MTPLQKKRLSALMGHRVQWGCTLKEYTTFSIGGPADALAGVENRLELQQLLLFLEREDIPWRVIGRGSNLLVNDRGFPGVIIVLEGAFRCYDVVDYSDPEIVLVKAGAGCSLARLLGNCAGSGLEGLEFVVGIPGTVGGALIMNAGAWGKDMGSIIQSVTLMTSGGEHRLSGSELDFSYRLWHGFEKYRVNSVIIETEFNLKKGNSETIKNYCRQLSARRKEKQPPEYRTAGSFFKNPVNDSAGRLIEASGLKGVSVGGAVVSECHANFLVNRDNATASDVLNLMQKIQERVKKDSGVELEPEVHFV